MTTQAPPKPTQPALELATEQPTATLRDDQLEEIHDSLRLLEHPALSQTLSPGTAPRGQYLALSDGVETRLLSLDAHVTHLGRGLNADVRFEQKQVSRDHAIVVLHGRQARVLDNRSANGTYVNGRRITAANVRNGDQIAIGPLVLRYVQIS
jgi:pSer/pThr/pTyr-binding forkhead associated (FHA) protein